MKILRGTFIYFLKNLGKYRGKFLILRMFVGALAPTSLYIVPPMHAKITTDAMLNSLDYHTKTEFKTPEWVQQKVCISNK